MNLAVIICTVVQIALAITLVSLAILHLTLQFLKIKLDVSVFLRPNVWCAPESIKHIMLQALHVSV